MSRYKIFSISNLLAAMTFFFGLSGCINEDLSECLTELTVTLQAGNPTDEGAVGDAVLYVFGSNGQFLESRATQLGKREVFYHPKAGELTVVGWCNVLGGEVVVTSFTENSTINQGSVSLKPDGLHAGIYNSPSDLFFGSATAANKDRTEEIIVFADRMISRMNVTVRGLKQYAGYNDNNYSVRVETTKRAIDFTGQYVGVQAGYMPAAVFNSSGELTVPTFRLMPSLEEVFYVRLYHGDELIYETNKNSDGTLLHAVVNRTLNVLIDFTNVEIKVTVQNSSWTDVYQWEKIYN